VIVLYFAILPVSVYIMTGLICLYYSFFIDFRKIK
jgi:hypothetical protein